MPKLTSRCNRRGRCESTPVASVGLTAAPRKVSFEDGQQGGAPNSPSPVLPVLQEEPMMRKATLKRPATSLSLVELVKDEECDNQQSVPVSPVPSDQVMDEAQPDSPSNLSPWGHFVDMVIPSETGRTTFDYQDDPSSCCSSCRRRRRAGPYGEHLVKKRHALCFLQDEAPRKQFRLAPRKEPTDQLIGALHLLRVD